MTLRPLTLPHAAPGARIMGLGDYRPARIMSNEELAARVETSDEWIRQRVGIVTRNIAAPDESVVDMASAASAKALANAGITGADVDLVIAATSTGQRMPPTAAEVAYRIGASAPGSYDIYAACAGFCYALAAGADAVRARNARTVLVVGAEKMSDYVDWQDRGTCIIFADGAGAAVIRSSQRPGVGPVAWGSDGGRAAAITLTDADPYLRMEGQPVFRWATTALAPVARRACELAGREISDLDAVVLHQANLRIVDAITRALGLAPHTLVSRDLVDTGNTSAASVPMALTRLVESGQVRPGGLALLLAFGAGLTYAGQVVQLP